MGSTYVAWFEEIDKHDGAQVGGKGANLGEMFSAGFPVPYGFVVTSSAYFALLQQNNLKDRIAQTLAYLNVENTAELHSTAMAIQKMILETDVPKEIITQISEYYHQLVAKEQKLYKKKGSLNSIMSELASYYDAPLVAVRSSATAEDLPEASFAGQQETFLNVKGENHLIHKIRECWASLFTERAIYYRQHNNFDHLQVGLAAVIQRMVQSETSGIAFSIDPITNNKSVVTIEAIYGLGEYIVQGKVTPDHYEVEKDSLSIIKKSIAKQTISYIKKGNENFEITLTPAVGSSQKLPDSKIVELTEIIKKIEKHYYFPQDIEWALEKDQLYITQARPITTMKENDKHGAIDESLQHLQGTVLLKGDPASPGMGVGKPVILHSPKELDKIKKGDILVAEQTNPDYVPAMKKASGIITEKGGRTSHAAIVSRELGIPAVVGADDAKKVLAHVPMVSVYGNTGYVYKGNIFLKNTIDQKKEKVVARKTKTKVYVNLAEIERVEEVAAMHVDGIGLLRAEFMIADIGTHPKEIIKEGKQKVFSESLARKLTTFAKAFHPRPVIYRATDFKTNEYSHLKGGTHYEPKEENPMLGYRGATRYIADPHVFQMEIEALKKVRKAGYTNMYLMIPFVRSVDELIHIKKILSQDGIAKDPLFKLWMMAEIPSVAMNIESYIQQGIDGISIGTNDLTMLTLGVDRDNESVAHLYNEKDPAVTKLLHHIVSTAKKYNVTCSVCGQAPSDFPEIVEMLVKEGVTSLSVNIDAIDKTRELIYEIEKKL